MERVSTVTISRTQALNDDTMTIRDVPYDQVVRTDDPDQIIHVPAKRNRLTGERPCRHL